jgi:hypothetical protein
MEKRLKNPVAVTFICPKLGFSKFMDKNLKSLTAGSFLIILELVTGDYD